MSKVPPPQGEDTASDARSLAGGVGGNAVAKLATAGLSFALYLVLARALSPESFGLVALVLAWTAVGTALAGISMPWVLVRHVPEYLAEGDLERARGVVRFAQSRTLLFAVFLVLLVVVANRGGLLSTGTGSDGAVAIGAAMLVPSVLLANCVALLQACKRVLAAEVLSNVVRTALTIALVGLVAALGTAPMTAGGALQACLAALVVVTLVCLGYQRATRPAGWSGADVVSDGRRWWKTARSFFAVFVVAAVSERVDILMLGFTGAAQDVAVYAVAIRFAQVMAMVVNASNAVLAPHFVERLGELRRGESAGLQALVAGAARTCTLLLGFGALAFVAAGPWLLAMFGEVYAASYAPLAILALGQLAASLFGPGNAVAALAERPAIPVATILAGTLVNVGLNVALVPALGASGAAVATAAGLVVSAGLSRWLTKRALGLDTSPFAAPHRWRIRRSRP